jgi:hypothetical protein
MLFVGYFSFLIVAFTVVAMWLTGLFFNHSTLETNQHPRPPIIETVPADKIAHLQLEVAKEASPAKDDVSPVKHHKPKMLARQRNNYGYGNSLGYAEETQYGPKRLFSNW